MYQRIACLTAGLLLCFVSVGQNHGPFSNSFPGFVEESTVYFSEADTIRYNSSLNFCEGGSVVLIANNAPPGANFEWKKDNAIIPLAIAGNYTATQSGSYTVIATSGTNTILYDTVDVIVYPRPLPAFSFTNNPCSGVAVVFSSSITSGTAPFTYSWNFGDGNTGTTANPSHVFESFGCGTQDYSVTLTVTDAHGCSNSVTSSITVKQRPEVALRDPNNLFSPFSNCANSPTPQNANYSITVENVSPNNSCITSYAIDWGDGNIQNNVSFPLNHTYTVLGAFNMVVTATGANGCESKKTYVVANQTNPA
ncbi:MAG: PKD domain-containing protein, partial [Flavisolibacter sp.]